MTDKKEIFISISAGIHSNGIAEQGLERKVTPEQLVEYRKIIGLETVTKILSLYYGLKDKEEPVSHEQEES
jgi:hypothetical protein